MENERLRLRIEALERLAAESRQAEEARRESEERTRRSAEERRRHEAEVLGRVTSEIDASLNLDTVLRRVGEGARELCGGDVAGVALRESGAGALVLRFWTGVPGDDRVSPRLDQSSGLTARVLQTGRAARAGRYAPDLRLAPAALDAGEPETISALMAVPILLGSQVEGVIYVGNETARPFTDGDEASVQRLADHAVVAIQNARQLRGHMRRQAELTALYEVTGVLTGDLDDAAIMGALHPLLGRLLDARHVLALRWNGEAGEFDLVWASEPGWAPGDAGLEASVVERAEPIRTMDYLATCAEEGRKPSPYGRGFRYALTVPMRAVGRVVGTLSFWSGERPYSRADEEFAAAVGALLALRLTRPSGR